MKVNGMTNIYLNIQNNLSKSKPALKSSGTEKGKDFAVISNTAKVYDKIDTFLNLGSDNRLDLSDLNDAERKEFYKILADLMKRGIVGYEYLDVNGRKEKHFITNRIGDERTYGARRWKDRNYFKPKPQR